MKTIHIRNYFLLFPILLVQTLFAQEYDNELKILENGIKKITSLFYEYKEEKSEKKLVYAFISNYDSLGRRVKSYQPENIKDYSDFIHDSLGRNIQTNTYTNGKLRDRAIYLYKENYRDYFQLRLNNKKNWDTLVYQRHIYENNLLLKNFTFMNGDTFSIDEIKYINDKADTQMSYTFIEGEKYLEQITVYRYNDLEQLDEISYHNGEVLSKFIYDEKGNLIRVVNVKENQIQYMIIYKYNDENLLIEKDEIRSNGLNTLEIYKYEFKQ
ncbi:MAG: hypothetical protein H6605_02415 [Flavobacteriales bacterium]|nr:hypothetical protein [Flavobacteriales bacterium]